MLNRQADIRFSDRARICRVAGMCALLMSLSSQVHAYGLSDDFGQKIFIEAVKIIGGYIPFVIGIVLIARFFLRGRWGAGVVTTVAVLAIFVGYPLYDRHTYYATRDKIMAPFTFPDTIDLAGKDILFVGHSIYGGGGCRKACVVLGRHGPQASLHAAVLPDDVSAAFYERMTGPIDLHTLPLMEIAADPEGYQGITKEPLAADATRDFDYVIFSDLNDEISPALAPWYADASLPDDALMNSLIFMAVPDDRNFDIGAGAPDIFIPYHRGRFQTVPLNPFVTKFDQINNSWEFSRDLARMLCLDVTPKELDRCRRDL